MLPLQEDIENFLVAEAAVGLANVRAHLEWACAAGGDSVTLSREGAARIIANLRRIELRAGTLSDLLTNGRVRRVGLEETLRKFVQEVA